MVKTIRYTLLAAALSFIAPYMVKAQTTPSEKKTDTIARQVMHLMNAHQTDSLYLLAGEHFKAQFDAATFKNICDNGLYTLTPLSAPIFVGSKNGVNKYKLDKLQFLISLDKQGKFEVLAVQEYHEDAQKAVKALTDNPLKTHLDSVVDKAASAYIQTKGNVGVSIAVYSEGADHYYNYGEIKQGNNQLPNRNTLYDIGSITKTFTSTLLAMAVNSGKISLKTSITQLLPDSVAANPALKGITLVQLSNHTSGLPRLAGNMEQTVTDPNQPYGNYDAAHLFTYLKGFKPTRQPGTQYEYSNLGAALLGVLLERVYHQPYAQLVNIYIIKPTGMNSTGMTISTADAGRIAQGYNEELKPVAPWYFKAFQAAGGLKSSAADMLRYAKLQLQTGNTPLNKAVKFTHQTTYQDGQQIVGLGWHYLGKTSKVVQHSGGTGGYRTLIGADLEKDFAVVVLTNNATSGDALGIELIQALRTIK
jgi:CubicO group peptidase (beta-lactamase class C family)